MTKQNSAPIPAPESYFAACISAAESAGLKLLGRATISSEDHRLRDDSLVERTSVPNVLFLRHTTLVFVLPGKAFLLIATYAEEQRADIPWACKNVRVPVDKTGKWDLTLVCGTHPGQSPSSDKWLYVATNFVETRLHASASREHAYPDGAKRYADTLERGTDAEEFREGRNRLLYGSFQRGDEKEITCDASYSIALGNVESAVTPERFGEAMANLINAVHLHLRDGKLLGNHYRTFGLVPNGQFRGCSTDFLRQFSTDLLLEAFESVPTLLAPNKLAARDN